MGLEVAGVWVEQEKQSEGSEGWTREVGSRGRCGWKGDGEPVFGLRGFCR